MRKSIKSKMEPCTFEDGSFAAAEDLQKAKQEIQAFLLFLGVPHTSVFNDRKPFALHKGRVCEAMPATDACWLEAMTHEQLRQIRPRLSLKKLNNEERCCLGLQLATPRALAWRQGYQRIRETLNHIADRPKGWSLLNTTTEKDLIKLVKRCYGPELGHAIHKGVVFPHWMLLQLVARRIRLETVKPATKRTTSPKRATRRSSPPRQRRK